MADAAVVEVSRLLDERGLSSFQIKLIVWSILIAMIDGYDIGAIAFAAPHLITDWHISPKALGLVLSASNIGVLFGSQIFGWIGDVYGRKAALITANLLFGVLTYWLPIPPTSLNYPGCGFLPVSGSAALSRTSLHLMPNWRRATCEPRWQLSP